jgi:hypothetical protein
VDAENEQEKAAAILDGMTKADRRQTLRQVSFQWADEWNAQHVLVVYDVSNGRGEWAARGCQVKGIAYRTGNTCGGWGRLHVLLDAEELSRVTHGHHPEWWWLSHDRLDGFDWSPGLTKLKGEPERYSFELSWGQRHEIVLERYDE